MCTSSSDEIQTIELILSPRQPIRDLHVLALVPLWTEYEAVLALGKMNIGCAQELELAVDPAEGRLCIVGLFCRAVRAGEIKVAGEVDGDREFRRADIIKWACSMPSMFAVPEFLAVNAGAGAKREHSPSATIADANATSVNPGGSSVVPVAEVDVPSEATFARMLSSDSPSKRSSISREGYDQLDRGRFDLVVDGMNGKKGGAVVVRARKKPSKERLTKAEFQALRTYVERPGVIIPARRSYPDASSGDAADHLVRKVSRKIAGKKMLSRENDGFVFRAGECRYCIIMPIDEGD